jgi:membrane protease YdiL (CAAX protease family)
MSILLDAIENEPMPYRFMVTLAVIALAFAASMGLFRARSVIGPRRIAESEDPRTLLLIVFIMAMAWLAIPLLYLGAKQQGIFGAVPPAGGAGATTQVAPTTASVDANAPTPTDNEIAVLKAISTDTPTTAALIAVSATAPSTPGTDLESQLLLLTTQPTTQMARTQSPANQAAAMRGALSQATTARSKTLPSSTSPGVGSGSPAADVQKIVGFTTPAQAPIPTPPTIPAPPTTANSPRPAAFPATASSAAAAASTTTASSATQPDASAPDQLSPTEQVCLGAASAPLLLLLGLALTKIYRPDGFELLGFTRGRVLPGLAVGFVGIIIILPLMFWVNIGTEALWDALNQPHENEHELLKFMSETTDSRLVDLAGLSAIVLAPFFEEFVFRGYLQTIFVAVLAKYLPSQGNLPRWQPAGFGAAGGLRGAGFGKQKAETALAVSPLGGPLIPNVTASSIRAQPWAGPLARWGGILCAALCFAMVHAWWMRPPIFFLAVALGYLYERTGNLWACITVHALFNCSSIFLYLSLQPH